MARNRKADFNQVSELYVGTTGLFEDTWVFFMKEEHKKYMNKYTLYKLYPYLLNDTKFIYYPLDSLVRLK